MSSGATSIGSASASFAESFQSTTPMMIFAPEDTVYVERGTYLQAMAPKLEAMGHKVGFVPPGMFKANAIEQVDGRWAGAADPRSEGAAVSE